MQSRQFLARVFERIYSVTFLGPGIFREFEIRELIIYDFPPDSL